MRPPDRVMVWGRRLLEERAGYEWIRLVKFQEQGQGTEREPERQRNKEAETHASRSGFDRCLEAQGVYEHQCEGGRCQRGCWKGRGELAKEYSNEGPRQRIQQTFDAEVKETSVGKVRCRQWGTGGGGRGALVLGLCVLQHFSLLPAQDAIRTSQSVTD
jgi:hypothetical protein